MPLMIVSENDWESAVNSVKNDEQSSIKRIEIKHGRGNVKEVPSELREVIAEESLISGDNKGTADAFKVSQSSVSAYKNGVTSTANYNGNKQVHARERVSKKALSRTLAALNEITPERIKTVENLKDLVGIAKDLATVTDKLSPASKKDELNDRPQVHLHIYTPKMKALTDYEVIDAATVE